jgi:starch synthase
MPAEDREVSAPTEARAKDEPTTPGGSAIPGTALTAETNPIVATAAPVAPEAAESETAKSASPSLPLPTEEQMIQGLPALQPPKPAADPQGSTPPPPPRMIPSMYVVMLASELAPVAKVGGLGDVVYGLSRELELRGNAVEIILPKYDNMRYDHIWGLTRAYENLRVPWFGGAIATSVWFGFVHGRKCFFIEPHSADNFFNRGMYYGQSDDVMRFAFFCRAAMEFLFKTGKQPDIIHCHDWQTALAPVLLWEMYQHLGLRHSRVCFTVHNFRHQGLTGEPVLRATGLNRPEYFFHYDRLRDNGNPCALNLMKGGIVYSNFVTTVSPRHAWEAKDDGQGFGLEPTLHQHQCKFGGVLNGLDYEQFNPETDAQIPAHFNAASLDQKYEDKRALRNRFWLADNQKPIVAFIGRLDAQKGLELVRHAIFYALRHEAQFVLLGNSPERAINDHFLGLKQQLNNSPDCHLEIGYHEELARLIYAGADLLIVPSRYEPCGLTQLIALRYGTVPVVRAVGGLADTVFDKDYSNRPLHERNGYVFEHADHAGLESALHRAIRCYYDFPAHFRELMLNGMRSDYSWNHPGRDYLNIYDYIRDK